MVEEQTLDEVPEVHGLIELDGMTLHTLEPGEIDVKLLVTRNLIDLNFSPTIHNIGVNSDRRRVVQAPAKSLAYFPKGTHLSMATTNISKGFMLEVSDALMTQWCDKSEIDGTSLRDYYEYEQDNVACQIGGMLIDQMAPKRFPEQTPSDKLTLEVMSLTIGARLMARMEANGRLIEEQVTSWENRCDRKSIARAMDYAEANLHYTDLSVSEMAASACLSPCHFSTVFKAEVGETPYNYILRRRAERAKVLLQNTRDPMAMIAIDVGFSSQSHMSTMVKRRYGITPKQLRHA